MSQGVKVFEVEQEEQLPPIPFQICFKRLDGTKENHDFHVYGEAPVGTAFALESSVRRDNHDRARLDLMGLKRFFRSVMADDDYFRLLDLLDHPDVIVDLPTIVNIYHWLTEEYFDRPTRRSSTSSNGRPITATLSTAPQSSADSDSTA